VFGKNGAGQGPYLQQAPFLPNTLSQAGEVFVVLKSNVTSGGTTYSWASFSNDGNSSHYPFGNDIYDNFGSSRQNGTPSGGGNTVCRQYGILNISSGGNGGLYVMRHQGTQFYSGGPFNATWGTNNWRIFASGQNAPANFGLQGDIAEILVYNGVCSSGVRASAMSYLQTKYAL